MREIISHIASYLIHNCDKNAQCKWIATAAASCKNRESGESDQKFGGAATTSRNRGVASVRKQKREGFARTQTTMQERTEDCNLAQLGLLRRRQEGGDGSEKGFASKKRACAERTAS
ncbi:putative myosin light chain kinase, smooth [Sesbania bispinosa]|nr:putative myosin light chain kinase, smooth [Sesbania bispinosa]